MQSLGGFLVNRNLLINTHISFVFQVVAFDKVGGWTEVFQVRETEAGEQKFEI